MSTPKGLERTHVSETVAGYVFMAPFLLGLGLFVIWPLLNAFWLSFHSYDLFSPPRWVGLDNYIFLLKTADFWKSIANTTYYTVVVVTFQTCLSILLALIMDQRIRGKTFFRVAFFLPSVTSSVAISLIFMFLFFKNGVVNQALAALHLDVLLRLIGLATPVDWLGDPRTALPTIMIQNIWSTAGFFMIIFLAGLQDIPESLYEAARVDGATPVQQFFHITLPLLKPTTFYVVTMGLIGCFQIFDQVYVMTDGGPLKATLTTAYLLYKEAFVNFNMGYACAIAFVLAGIIFASTMLQKRLMGE
ncbi:MAG: permease component of ABC-type sugar transporter [Cyanobacteria bacterium RYN_339]|nr:permease component of ABC-type sugar transporter [Cyanobacteria bacterium RYN_339]